MRHQKNEKNTSDSIDIEERNEIEDSEDLDLLKIGNENIKFYAFLLLLCSLFSFILAILFFSTLVESINKMQMLCSFNHCIIISVLIYNTWFFIFKSKEIEFFPNNKELEKLLLDKSKIDLVTLKLLALSLFYLFLYFIAKKKNVNLFGVVVMLFFFYLFYNKKNLNGSLEILIGVLTAFIFDQVMYTIFHSSIEIYLVIGFIFCSVIITFQRPEELKYNIGFIFSICLYHMNYYSSKGWIFKAPFILVIYSLVKNLKATT